MENQAILSSRSSAKLNECSFDTTSECSSKENNSYGLPKRYVLAIFAFFGFFFAYVLRADLSVAIVEMSYETVTVSASNPYNKTNNNYTLDIKRLKWTPVLQGYILSSFFYGYIVTQLPAGCLSNIYGGKVLFGAGIGICSLINLIIPAAAKVSPTLVIICRILQGLAQGFIFPSMHCLWSKWSPTFERSRLTTFALSGSYIGTVCALSFGGIIGRNLNWEAIFYIFGVLGLVWTVFWFLYIHESPSVHKSISLQEKLFVESSLTHHVSSTIPWLQIIKSGPVWAIIFAHFAENWGFYTMMTELPTILSQSLKYKVDKAGLVSALPYFTMAIVLYSSGYISDCLIEKKKIKCSYVRKGFCCTGLFVQCIFMFLISSVNQASTLIAFVTIAIGFGGMVWASFGVNHLDIGSGYANILMSVSNLFATIPGIISPILTGHLIQTKERSDWNAVFYISAIIFLIGGILYGILGSGDLQSWAKDVSDYDNLNSQTPERKKSTDKSENVLSAIK